MKARTTTISLAVLLMGSVSAWAVPITFAFSGTVTDVDDFGSFIDGSVVPGAPFSGFYTFESSSVDSDPDLHVGDYPSPSEPEYVMSVQVGSYTITAPLGGIYLEDWDKDYYGVGTSWFEFLGHQAGMSIRLTDLNATMLTGDKLPAMPPSLDGLPAYTRSFGLSARDSTNVYFGVGGMLEELHVVPEPTVAFYGLVMWGLMLFRSRR